MALWDFRSWGGSAGPHKGEGCSAAVDSTSQLPERVPLPHESTGGRHAACCAATSAGLAGCTGALPIHIEELFTKPWPCVFQFFIFLPFDKLRNQVDTKNTGKDMPGDTKCSLQRGGLAQGWGPAGPRPSAVGSGPGLPSSSMNIVGSWKAQ